LPQRQAFGRQKSHSPIPKTPDTGTCLCQYPISLFVNALLADAIEANAQVFCNHVPSGDVAQELLLEDELPLLVLLRTFVSLVVLPPDHLFTLPASDVSHGVSAGSHVAVARLRCLGIHHAVEEEGFAMLATEVLRLKSVSVGLQ
jgi:hypothetical protein